MSGLLQRDRVYEFLVPKVVDNLDLTHGTVLYMEDVSVSFDGFKAINELNFYVESGELRCVIGPNGAGKTTMMDIITGKTRPDTGSVWFGQRMNLLRMSEPEIAQAGIGRKFQKPTVFEKHSVFENLELSMSGPKGVWPTLIARLSTEQRAKIDFVCETIGLTAEINRPAGLLSHGQKQWLEIAMLVGQDPDLLLVDEPVAGLTDEETDLTADLLKSLAGDHTVLVIEHDMEFIRRLDSPVTVLHQGNVLCEGTMDQVQADPRVIEVYLGTSEEEHP